MLSKLRHRLATGEIDYGSRVRMLMRIYGFLLSYGLSEYQCFAVAAALLAVLPVLAGGLIWAVWATL